MNVTVLYIGSSLLAPLKDAEREINRDCKLDLRIAAHNFGAPLSADAWSAVRGDLAVADIVFVIHVMDGENAACLIPALEEFRDRHRAVIVINCMPDLMRHTRMGRLDAERLLGRTSEGGTGRPGRLRVGSQPNRSLGLLSIVGSWVGKQVTRARSSKNGKHGETRSQGHSQYLKFIDKLPGILKFVPAAGTLRDIKHYLYIFCYFLQPTPANIRAMILYALKHYAADSKLRKLEIPQPETTPSIAIYHPAADGLFEGFAEYRKWYRKHWQRLNVSEQVANRVPLEANQTIGLLLMRPQVISNTRKHYDALIAAIEAEGLSVIPAISTLMDNRKACENFFLEPANPRDDPEPLTSKARVSQVVSLTGFSFVGGPAMNDSEAAAEFLSALNRPYRSAVSLDTQTIEDWEASQTGLNPIQAGMQIAIPEIDGATEPFVYGGIQAKGVEPMGLDDRCHRFARRLRRWNRLRTAPRSELKLALVLFCFPPNKGNIGTAADLDVFPSVWDTLLKLEQEGYSVALPASANELRAQLLKGNSDRFGTTANVAYRMNKDELRRVCPYIRDVESEWGPAPGRINSFGGELLVQGLSLGNVFLGIQPTFGYEGDPMRLMMARGGAPHHGFVAFYSYLTGVLNVDAVLHVGTHGALEFMPGKQIGLSRECWPDRLIGELPNIYLYSVNNPSEGSIARRRSYAELISYLTPPIENAGLYKEFATLKEMVMAYRQAGDDLERSRLFGSIEELSHNLNLDKKTKKLSSPSPLPVE
ncbi:MAG TPA: cobaltochelatase subunit CobN [Pyrinomonadaceae bacterium]|nr:cobaltochelatase subunit CobN [Pyrinomonadaceae bacterium]